MSVELAAAYVSIIPSARGISRQLTGELGGPAQSAGADAGRMFGGSFGKAFKVAGMAAVAGAAAGIGIAAKGAFAAIDFDQQMREVFTLLPDISEDAMSEMSDQVKDFSKEFGVLPDEVVPALYQSLSAGVPKDNVFEFLETAQMAAKGGVTELTTAVDGISSVTNAYGSEVLDATEASDLMFTAVRLGKTNMDELSQSLFQVTPTAAGLGVRFGDVTAGLAAMTAQGVPTRVATTQMRQLFIELSKEGGQAAGVFEDMAGKTFKDFIAEGGNTAEALDLMALAADEAGVGVADMFGSVEAGQAALALAGSETFTANLDEMAGAAGATEAAFGTMDQGLRPVIDRFKAWGQVMLIEIGERVIPMIEAVISYLEEHWPTISEVVSNVMDGVRDAIEPVVDWVQENWPTIKEVIETTFEVISTVIAEVVLPALGAFRDFVVDTLLPTLQTSFGWVRDNIGPILQTLADVFVEDVVPAMQAVVEYVSETLWPALQEAIGWVRDTANGIIDGLADVFDDVLLPALTATTDYVTDTLWPGLQEAFNWVDDNIGPILEGFAEDIDMLVGKFGDLWDATEEWRLHLATSFQDGIQAGQRGSLALAGSLDSTRFALAFLWERSDGFRSFMAGEFRGSVGMGRRAIDFVTGAIRSAWSWTQRMWDRFSGFRDDLSGTFIPNLNTFRGAWSEVSAAMGVAFDAVVTFSGYLIGAFRGAVAGGAMLIGVIWTGFKTVEDWAIRAKNAIDNFARAIRELPSRIPGAGLVGDLVGAIPGFATGTRFAPGGLAVVGEEGPELVNLPRGSQVFDTRASQRMASDAVGSAASPAFPDTVTLVVEGEPITARIRRHDIELADTLAAGRRV